MNPGQLVGTFRSCNLEFYFPRWPYVAPVILDTQNYSVSLCIVNHLARIVGNLLH